MNCPKCNNPIDVGSQLSEADKDFYEGVTPPIVLMIMCETCDLPTCSITIDGVEGFEDVESPLGTVKVPKI